MLLSSPGIKSLTVTLKSFYGSCFLNNNTSFNLLSTDFKYENMILFILLDSPKTSTFCHKQQNLAFELKGLMQ